MASYGQEFDRGNRSRHSLETRSVVSPSPRRPSHWSWGRVERAKKVLQSNGVHVGLQFQPGARESPFLGKGIKFILCRRPEGLLLEIH